MFPNSDTAVIPSCYTVLQRLGGGAQGTVYLVRDTRSRAGNRLALKVCAADQDTQDALRHEGQVLTALGGLCGPRLYESRPRSLAMDYIPGQSWGMVRAGGGRKRALGWLRHAAQEVALLHDAGWCHGDLKPDNILCLPDGSARIIDFGAARRRFDDAQATEPFRVDGGQYWTTPAYAPPPRERADIRDDVYSMAVMLHDVLAGKLPEGSGAVCSTPRPAGVSATGWTVLRRALSPDRTQRPWDVMALVRAVVPSGFTFWLRRAA